MLRSALEELQSVFTVVFARWGQSGVTTRMATVLAFTAFLVFLDRRRREGRLRFRNARTDAVYMLFYLGGAFGLLISSPVQRGLRALVDAYAPFLRLGVVEVLPLALQVVVITLIMDGVGYWVHRSFHTNRFLWAFHSIHHSQESFSPLTNFRAHFVDVGLQSVVVLVLGLVLGAPAATWAPLSLFIFLVALLAHSGLPWTYGPLEKIVVSPRHHRIHHSIESRHYMRNLGMTFSFWDHLFGTADTQREAPAAYGIKGLDVPESFTRQLAFPFLMLARELRAARRKPRAGAPMGMVPGGD